MAALEEFVAKLNGYVWGVPLILLLFCTHLFLTVRLGFIQRFTWRGIRLSVTRDPGAAGEVSQFGALATALASTIGAGNIVGVASAVAAGGPGAVFWMWLTGVFGIATKYAEAVLSIRYRVQRESGEYVGGPMYVLERGLGQRWLSVLFCLFAMCAGLGMANMVQSNTLVGMTQAGLPDIAPGTIAVGMGLVLMVAVGAVIIGGIHSISRTSAVIVPAMAALYVAACVVVIFFRLERMPDTLALILRSAFEGQAAVGGFLGAGVAQAMRYGIARGLFSNESGLGSAPIAAAAARTSNPVRQGIVSATGTFWDTVVVCALTGLVVVSSGHWQEGLPAAALVRSAFADLGTWAVWALNLSLGLFVLSSIFGWAYYSEKAAEYLWGSKSVRTFRWVWCAFVFIGAVVSSRLVWDLADIANGLMAIPNLIALLALHRVVVEETKKHRAVLTG
jgi:AGCS family alanine or glycine:cation symporter